MNRISSGLQPVKTTKYRQKSARSSLLTVDRILAGFLQYKVAEGLSPRTIASYRADLQLWIEYQGNVDVDEVSTESLRQYLNYMRIEYVPRRITGNNEQKLSAKTIRNIYISLRAFFRWVAEEFQIDNPMLSIPAPRFTDAPVEPFSKDDIEAMLKACDYCEEARTNQRRKFTMRRPTARRDKALILTLVDTGLRASELCSLRIRDLDEKTGKVHVRHGVYGGAKGGKGRFVYLGKTARRVLWRYLADREDRNDPDAPLFVGLRNRSMNKDGLRHVIHNLGEKAGVKKAHPHRFRHTFAITYLRSGGDIFTLKTLLGHSSLDMVQHYARVAEVDVELAHRRASPADNWRL